MTNVFKTGESRNIIRSRYNQILRTFPFKQQYVETSFGKTFILSSGAPGNPVLILLHGSCSNSAFWFGEITMLSYQYHVLAVDILGEAGNSAENRLDLHGDAYADWFKEVLDACAIEKAVVMGNSLGSWMALKFSVKYPECVSRLILIAPSGLSKQNTGFLKRAKTAALTNEALKLDSSVVQGNQLPKEVEEFINLILWGYNPITDMLPGFADEQLIRLAMPILFIAGKDDILVDTRSAAQRLSRLIPGAKIHLLENNGHTVLNALEYVLPFLAD
jgi:pimeloyl-ACP methyl ester carboxylesterase